MTFSLIINDRPYPVLPSSTTRMLLILVISISLFPLSVSSESPQFSSSSSSSLRTENGLVPDAGISVVLTEKALGHFSHLAQLIVPDILNDVRLPNITGTGYDVRMMKLFAVQRPVVRAVMVSGQGFNVTAVLSNLSMVGNYKIGFGWASTEGAMNGTLHNYTFNSMIGIKRTQAGHPIFQISNCLSTVTSVNLTFHGGWTSFVVNSISDIISEYLKEYLSTLLCNILVEATKVSENSTAPGYCETHEAYTNVGGKVSLESGDFMVNFSMNDDPGFSHLTSSLGLNGSILYTGTDRAIYRSRPVVFQHLRPHGNLNPLKMARVTITDYVGNSFFTQVFKYNMAKINQSMSTRRLPQMLWGPAGFFCRKCFALVQGGMTAAPQLQIEPGKGVILGIHGWVRTTIHGFYRRAELFKVKTYIGVNVYPYVSKGKLFADTLLNDIRISTKGASGSLSRVFGFSMRGLIGVLKSFLPAQIKPPVQRDLKRVFGKKGGMPLPSFCGVSFKNTKMFYIEKALVIDADLDFDTQPLIRLLRELIETGGSVDINEQVERNKQKKLMIMQK